jgi:hypothetical protein
MTLNIDIFLINQHHVMKKIVLSFLFFLCSQLLTAQIQKSISVGAYRYFVSTDNAAIMYNYRKGKKEWGIGLKYHFNASIWDFGYINLKRMYSHHVEQNFGLMGEYRRYLWSGKKWSKFVQPYVVYNMAASYKEVQVLTYGYFVETNTYGHHLFYVPQCLIIDNNVGVGARFYQYNNWNGFIQFGIGFAAGYGVPTSDIFHIPYTYASIASMASCGITYNISTKMPEKKKRLGK